MITLDWDEIDGRTAELRCEDIIKWEFVEYIDLFRSPTGNGFHVYISTGYFDPSQSALYNLRKMWHDDPKRMKNDILVRDGQQSVLFQYKIIDGNCYHDKFIKRFTK